MKYRWIRIKDITGEVFEFEDADLNELPGRLIIFFPAPLGTVRKDFYKRNLITIEKLVSDRKE